MQPDDPDALIDASESLIVKIDQKPHLPEISNALMDDIFDQMAREKPIFDGTLLCVSSFCIDSLKVYELSYKEYLASKFLKNYPLRHRVLAVSAWTYYKGHVLFGRRSKQVTFYSGYLELVPSGGVDASAADEQKVVHYQKALLNEFEEETGLSLDLVDKVKVEGIYFCRSQSIFDICHSIHLSDESEIEVEKQNPEYDELFWVPLEKLKDFQRKNHPNILPLSSILIEQRILPSLDLS